MKKRVFLTVVNFFFLKTSEQKENTIGHAARLGGNARLIGQLKRVILLHNISVRQNTNKKMTFDWLINIESRNVCIRHDKNRDIDRVSSRLFIP